MLNSFATPWTAARQAPLPTGFPRREYWSRLPFPSPGGFPNPRDGTNISSGSCIGRQSLYYWATWEDQTFLYLPVNNPCPEPPNHPPLKQPMMQQRSWVDRGEQGAPGPCPAGGLVSVLSRQCPHHTKYFRSSCCSEARGFTSRPRNPHWTRSLTLGSLWSQEGGALILTPPQERILTSLQARIPIKLAADNTEKMSETMHFQFISISSGPYIHLP